MPETHETVSTSDISIRRDPYTRMASEAAAGSLFTSPQDLTFNLATPGTEVSALYCTTDLPRW